MFPEMSSREQQTRLTNLFFATYMPISEDEFERGTDLSSPKKKLLEFLQSDPNHAYSIDELVSNVAGIPESARDAVVRRRLFIEYEVILRELIQEGKIRGKMAGPSDDKSAYFIARLVCPRISPLHIRHRAARTPESLFQLQSRASI